MGAVSLSIMVVHATPVSATLTPFNREFSPSHPTYINAVTVNSTDFIVDVQKQIWVLFVMFLWKYKKTYGFGLFACLLYTVTHVGFVCYVQEVLGNWASYFFRALELNLEPIRFCLEQFEGGDRQSLLLRLQGGMGAWWKCLKTKEHAGLMCGLMIRFHSTTSAFNFTEKVW